MTSIERGMLYCCTIYVGFQLFHVAAWIPIAIALCWGGWWLWSWHKKLDALTPEHGDDE